MAETQMVKYLHKFGEIKRVIVKNDDDRDPDNQREVKEMKKRVLAVVMGAMMAMSLMACGGGSDSGSTSEPASTDSETASTDGADADAKDASGDSASGEYNISVILKTLSAEYWNFVKAGCDAYAAENPGITVDVKGPTSETAFDEQQNMIETDLSSGAYDAFVISPLQADMVTTLIAGEEKPVIALDTLIEAPEIRTFVGTGNENAAAMGGKAAVEAAKAAGWEEVNAICITGVQGDSTATARMTGYQKGIEEAGGTYLADETQYADAVADKAVNSMEAIMQNHPEGVAIICCNNDDMAVAAARAAAANEAYKDTIFLGFNGDKTACEAILNDELTMSVAQEAYNMGYMAVEEAVKALNGEELEEFTDSGCDVVTKDNAQERLDTLKGYLGE